MGRVVVALKSSGALRVDVLPNGLRVISEPMSSTRSASASVYVGAGAQYEPEPLAGVSHMIEHCLFKGSALYPTAAELALAVESSGGFINAATSRESTFYFTKVPGPDWQTALDVVVDMAAHPRFERAELEKERSVILEELAQVEDSPYQLLSELVSEIMWRGTPLGRDIAGTPDSVTSIPYDEAVNYWRAQYSPDNVLVSVAGEVDSDAALARVAELTADWQPTSSAERIPAPLANDGRRVAVRVKETEQTQIGIALPGVGSRHHDRFALALLTRMLGDGMSSRLFLKVREELGLVYDIHAGMVSVRDSGILLVSMGVDPENAEQALEAALGELARIRDGATEEELQRMQRLTAGRLLMGLEDTRAVADWNGNQALLYDEIQTVDQFNADFDAVTTEDIARVANEYLREDQLRLAVVGPKDDSERLEACLRF